MTPCRSPSCLGRYDRPYVGSEGYYGKELFCPEDLKRLKGRFILSNLDCPQVREAFDGCEMEAVPVKYTVGGKGKPKTARELIVTGGAR